MKHPNSLTVESLLTDTDWVRDLARRLVGDLTQADDLSQDAWVAVLRARQTPRDPKAWLAGIVRNLNRRELRTQSARRTRERRRSGAEETAATDELTARAEIQRRLIGHVLELPDVYRGIVLAHFFEGLSIENACLRHGLPGSTGRTRLQRALERLRERLFEDEAQDRSALPALVALARPVPRTTAVFAGGLSVGVLAAAVVVTAGAVGLFVGWARSTDDPPLPSPALAAHAELSLPPSRPPRQDVPMAVLSDSTSGRASGARKEQGGGASAAASAVLYGTVKDVRGGAPRAATVTFENAGREHTVRVTPSGAWATAGLAPGVWAVRVAAEDSEPLQDELEVSGSDPLRRDFVLGAAWGLDVRITLPDGTPLGLELGGEESDVLLGDRTERQVARFPVPIATATRPESRLPELAGRAEDGYGLSLGWEPRGTARGRLLLGGPPPWFVSLALGRELVATRWVESDGDEVVFALDPDAITSGQVTSSLRLVDADTGRPLATGSLRVVDAWGTDRIQRSDGRPASFAPGPAHVLAEALGYATRDLVLELGPEVVHTIELTKTARLAGSVVGPDGRPLATAFTLVAARDATVPLRHAPGTLHATDANGHFAVDAPRTGELWLRFTEFAVNPVRLDAGASSPHELVLARGTRTVLAGASDGRHVRVTLLDSDGPFFVEVLTGGERRSIRLLPGTYTVRWSEGERLLREENVAIGGTEAFVALEATARGGSARAAAANAGVVRVLHGSLERHPDAPGTALDTPVYVTAVDADGTKLWTRLEDGATEFALAGLTPGPWWVRAHGKGHLSWSRRLEVEPQDRFLPLAPTLGVGRVVRITALTPDGRPLSDFRPDGLFRAFRPLAFTHEPGERLAPREFALPATLWPERGGFGKLEPADVGWLELSEAGDVWIALVANDHVLAKQALGSRNELTFTLDPELLSARMARLSFRPTNAAGTTLTEGRVTFRYPSWRTSFGFGDLDRRLAHHHLPGRVLLELEADGYGTLKRELDLAPGPNDLGDLVLAPERTLRGRVLRAGEPVPEAYVAWTPVSDPEHSTSAGVEDGSFELAGLPADGIWLRALEPRFTETVGHVLRLAPDDLESKEIDAVFELVPSALLTLRAEGPGGACSFEVRTTDGWLLRSGALLHAAPVAVELAPDATYELRVFDEAGRETLRDVLDLPVAGRRITVAR